MRTISKSNPKGNPNDKQSAPSSMKTDQEILEQLKGTNNNESRRNIGLVAFVVLLAIVIGVFTAVNNRTDNDVDDENSVVAADTTDNSMDESENKNDNAVIDEDSNNNESAKDSDNSEVATSDKATKDSSEEVSVTATAGSFSLEPTTGSSHTDSEYTETAQAGEGVTHLARRAANTYMSDMDITDISREQRVYIEDYLSKMNTPVSLNPSNTRTFQSSQIEEAISMARALTPAELTNLEQYSALVTVYWY